MVGIVEMVVIDGVVCGAVGVKIGVGVGVGDGVGDAHPAPRIAEMTTIMTIPRYRSWDLIRG